MPMPCTPQSCLGKYDGYLCIYINALLTSWFYSLPERAKSPGRTRGVSWAIGTAALLWSRLGEQELPELDPLLWRADWVEKPHT